MSEAHTSRQGLRSRTREVLLLASAGAMAFAACAATLAVVALSRSQYPLLSPAEGLGLVIRWSLVAGLGSLLPAAGVGALACAIPGRWASRGAFAAVCVGALAAAIWAGDRRGEAVWSRLGPMVDAPPDLAPPAAAPGASPPNLVLVTIDTLRRDHLSLYGYERPTSPFLDSLAREGTVFENAISHAPATERSMASLVSGLHPRVHDADRELRGGEGAYIGSGIHTLAERLHGAGYQTAGFVSNIWLRSSNGFGQGFVHYRDSLPISAGIDQPVDVVVAAAREWIPEARPPFLLWLHLIDPHHPYDPSVEGPWEDLAGASAPFHAKYLASQEQELGYTELLRALPGLPEPERSAERRYLVGRYDTEILQVDRGLRRLYQGLQAAGFDPTNTVLAVTSDHGEEFLDHGGVMHASTLFDELIRLPLLFHGAGVPEGRRVEAQVRMIDVTATLLDLAGASADGIHGRSLLPLLSGESEPDRVAVSSVGTRYRSYRTSEEKLIVSYDPYSPTAVPWQPWRSVPAMAEVAFGRRRREEVGYFDLRRDPEELRNEFASSRDRARQVYADLEGELARHPLLRIAPGEEKGLSEEERRQLRELGYLD